MATGFTEAIYHEKQDSGLCGQHCLNALLQGAYYSADALADIARQFDDSERGLLAEQDGKSTVAINGGEANFVSNNLNDAGWFSSQVLSKALEIWGLNLISLASPECENARKHPEQQKGYILNFRDHWYTIRRFGTFWMDLNSTLDKPNKISATYLEMLFQQLTAEGYQIFCVFGDLPRCVADELAIATPMSSHGTEVSATAYHAQRLANNAQGDDWELQTAIAMSLEDSASREENLSAGAPAFTPREKSPENLASEQPATKATPISVEDLRQRRLERFGSNAT